MVWEEECENITGAFVTRSASFIVSAETCERSISMPRRFISRMISSPNSVRPPCFSSSVAASAQPSVSECVSVIYPAPSLCRRRRFSIESSMQCPPSTPINDAILPLFWIRSMSDTVRAISKVSGYRFTIARTSSICSTVFRKAVPSSDAEAGTYTDQNCAPTFPCLRRGMSVCNLGTCCEISARSNDDPKSVRMAQGRSLCPSKINPVKWIFRAASVMTTAGRFSAAVAEPDPSNPEFRVTINIAMTRASPRRY